MRVPAPLSNHFFEYRAIIIKEGSQICRDCCKKWNHALKERDPFQFTIQDKYIEIYKPRHHTLSNKIIQQWYCKQRRLNKELQAAHEKISELEKRITELETCPNIHYKHYKNNWTKEDYDQALKDIPNGILCGRVEIINDNDMEEDDNTNPVMIKSSNRVINHVQYKLMTNYDCMLSTGCTKTHIIYQADVSKLHPFRVFCIRNRMYRYSPFDYMQLLFGMSSTWQKANWHKYLPVLQHRYAKPRLIHGMDPTN